MPRLALGYGSLADRFPLLPSFLIQSIADNILGN